MTTTGASGVKGTVLENSLARSWRRAIVAGGLLATALVVGALVELAAFDPRLLTWSEIVPPDEGLVGALLPGIVVAAVVATLGARARRIPSGIEVRSDGVGVAARSGHPMQRIPWSGVHVGAEGGSWEGTPVDLSLAEGRIGRWWVSRSVADTLRLHAMPPGAPHPPGHPRG